MPIPVPVGHPSKSTPTACRSAQPPAAQGNAGHALLLALAAGLAGFFWWKSRKQVKDGSSGRSPFRFPGAAKGKAVAPAPGAAAAAAAGLPRNKASNNKKNKARKKEKRAEKEAKPET
jgi:uncharacterized protein HemX